MASKLWESILNLVVVLCVFLGVTRLYNEAGSFSSIFSPTAWCTLDLDALPMQGRLAVITGADTELGKATAIGFAKLGAHVIIACRSKWLCYDVAQDIQGYVGGKVDALALDLASKTSIANFAENFDRISFQLDYLVHAMGNVSHTYTFNHRHGILDTERDLIEKPAHATVYLTNLLLLPLIKSKGRIIFQTSDIIQLPRSIQQTLPQGRELANLAEENVLLSQRLAEKLQPAGVRTVTVNPGVLRYSDNYIRAQNASNDFWMDLVSGFGVKTLTFFQSMVGLSSWKGAQALIHASLAPLDSEVTIAKGSSVTIAKGSSTLFRRCTRLNRDTVSSTEAQSTPASTWEAAMTALGVNDWKDWKNLFDIDLYELERRGMKDPRRNK